MYLLSESSTEFLVLFFHEDWLELVELYEKKSSSIANEFKVVILTGICLAFSTNSTIPSFYAVTVH